MSMVAPLIAARRNGLVLPITTPEDADEAQAELSDYYSNRGSYPDYLALVGSATAIPMTYVDDPVWTDNILATDLYYSIADEDSYPDIAIGRLLADDANIASLLISRISTYDDLRDSIWDQQFVEVGSWAFPLGRPLPRNYGYEDNDYLVNTMAGDEERIEAALIFHSGHSNWTTMGGAFTTSSTSILAPAVILSRGCSVAGIDQSSSYNYVTNHLAELGSVGFIGAPRTMTAHGNQVIIETENGILNGDPLGKAYQRGMQSITTNVLDSDGGNVMARARYNMMLLGDPALEIASPQTPEVEPVSTTATDNSIYIDIPDSYFSEELGDLVLDEWGWTGDSLYAASMPGVTARTAWSASGYNQYKYYYTASFTTNNSVSDVTQFEVFDDPLGMVGDWHIDNHQDGSQTIFWNVRVLDFDQETDETLDMIDTVEYSISFE
jgi:hypothetical protein